MENTSTTLHGDFMVYQSHREMIDGKRGNAVIAHELFHQWFGDLVTCESWSNLPLNESFATYGEYLWDEYKNGRTAADEHHYQSRQGYMMNERDEHPIRFDYRDKEDMFDAISYNKGGQILHMLRKAIGDDAFFAGLKNYLETNKFKSVEIHNLRLAMEETSGQDLNWFFNQWFLSSGRPKLRVTATEKQNGTLELIVEQKQDLTKVPLYRLPVDIDLYVGGKATRQRIVIEDQVDTFNLKVNGALQFLNFDAERQLLAELTYKKTKEQYNLQYQLGPLFGDRLEVLKSLELQMSDRQVFELFLQAAAADASSAIKMMCISKLEKAPQEFDEVLKRRMSDIYITDRNTLVRARALALLNKRYEKDGEVKEFNEQALREQSYAICGEALEYFSKVDPSMAMERAKAFENESGKDVIFPIAALYAERGTEAQAPFFHNALKYFNGFDAMSFISLYAKLAKRCNDVGCTIFAAGDFESFSLGANKFVKHACAKGLKDLIQVWDEKSSELQKQVDAAKATQKDASALEAKLKEAKETKDILIRKLDRVK
jgi:aminopeptidase N